MVDLFNDKDKRVFFFSGDQNRFLLKINKITGLSWNLLAFRLGISKRTLFDWRREKYSLPLSSLKEMCGIAKIDLPRRIKQKSPFWWAKKAAKLGGIATYKKYGTIGNPSVRRQRWLEWWERTGKYNPNKYFVTQNIVKPEKSKKLSEFVGIMIGDGGITKRQITISLNSIVDKSYSFFVKKLIFDLFKKKPSTHLRKKETTLNIVVSGTNLVGYCQVLGLKVGNKIKQKLDIPDWIKKNDEFLEACIRGLMDTDGCLFMERHKIKGKTYSYPRLSLVSASSTLRHSVSAGMRQLGYSPCIRNGRSVQLEKFLDIKRYFGKIGTNHPKNKEKFRMIFGGFG